MKKYEFIYGAIKADGEKQVYGAINKGISNEDPALVNLSQYKGEFKLVYAKDGKIFGSESGIPAENDVEIIEVAALYEEVEAEEEAGEKEEETGKEEEVEEEVEEENKEESEDGSSGEGVGEE